MKPEEDKTNYTKEQHPRSSNSSEEWLTFAQETLFPNMKAEPVVHQTLETTGEHRFK